LSIRFTAVVLLYHLRILVVRANAAHFNYRFLGFVRHMRGASVNPEDYWFVVLRVRVPSQPRHVPGIEAGRRAFGGLVGGIGRGELTPTPTRATLQISLTLVGVARWCRRLRRPSSTS
jgi:hypothetical protein